MDGHVVFRTVQQHDARFGRECVAEERCNKRGDVGWEGGRRAGGIGPRGPVVLRAEGQPAEFLLEELSCVEGLVL